MTVQEAISALSQFPGHFELVFENVYAPWSDIHDIKHVELASDEESKVVMHNSELGA